MQKEPISIAYAPDDKQASLALVSMISILENTKQNINFIILHSGLSQKNIKLFNSLKKYENCKIAYKKIDEKSFEGFPISSWVVIQTWFRVKIPDLFKDLKKVIYLDCDTLANDDITNLWNIDVSNHLLACVKDVWGSETKGTILELENKNYFNAGILLINCEKWRQNNIFDKIKKYATENYSKLTAGDQDVLNKIADNDKLLLPQKFNYLEAWWKNYYHEYKNEDLINYEIAKKNPVLIHFTAYKPTTFKSFHSFKNLWWEYAKKTKIYLELLENYKAEAEDFNKTKHSLEHTKIKRELTNIFKSIEKINETITY